MRAVLWILTCLALAAYLLTPLSDPDLWWHIVVGRWILVNKTVPSVDYWTQFATNQSWRAYSWLPEILYASVDQNFGVIGLQILSYLQICTLVIILCWMTAKLSADYTIGIIFGSLATIACSNHITLRPQFMTWIFMCLVILLARKISNSGLTLKYLFYTAVIFSLWANFHFSAVIGLITLAAWISTYRSKIEIFIVLLTAFIGTLFTPYFGAEWLTMFNTSTHPLLFTSIVEFQPANILQHSTGLLIIELILLLYFCWICQQKLPLVQYITCGFFVIAGLTVVKFLPYAHIYLISLLSLHWQTINTSSRSPANLTLGFIKLKELLNRFPKEGLSFLFLAFIVVKLNNNSLEAIDLSQVPVSALDFIEKHNLPPPYLNPFGSGGYLMYRLADSRGEVQNKVAIDGRTNLISDQLWQDFSQLYNGKAGWQQFINKVNPNTILWRAESPATQLLLQSPQWCLVFGNQQKGHVVFVKKEIQTKLNLISKNC